ncbi:hypothetical protein niasHT_021702 [Heterodera trifolii]|uniref:SSD domain-containing protein n=1 Tax=Heterodera trifolii TaxID=157864 RepID=A0ABD2KRM9_9BILA
MPKDLFVNRQLINPFGALQDLLARWFFRYGFFIAKHPHPFVVLPVLVTLLLMLGIINLHVEDDLRFLYSPEHSLSRFEYQIHKEFSGDSVNSSYIAIALEAAPPLAGVDDSSAEDAANLQNVAANGAASSPWWKNMLRREVANAIQGTMNAILHNMTVELPDGSYHFGNDICARMALCPISNSPVQLFYDAFFSEKLRKDTRIALNWPILKFFENKFFLPTNFYGVQLNDSAEGFDSIKSIQVVHLIYYVAGTEKYTADEVGVAVEKALRLALAERAHVLRSSLFSLSILKSEMQKNTTYTLPFISLTILLLMAFTVGSCMTGDWITSKPLEALLGLFSSSLAIGSAAGLLLMLGVPFISQVTVVPFLAFAIGVDDTYVMLGAWHDTKRNQCPERRMALSLEEAGSAITVTSLTSFMSFGIGSFSSTPAISIFCKFIATAILFDYIYQVTFFAAVMALGGRREAAGHHSLFVWRRMSKEDICKAKSTNFVSPTYHIFANILAPFLCHRLTRLGFIVLYALYMFGAFYGCSLLRPNLTPSRLLVDDSPLTHYLQLAESRIWSEGVIGRVYVNRAPDFVAHPEQLERLLRMVEELESTPFSMGPNSSQLWLREFNNYRQYFATDDAQNFYDTLKAFLKISFNKQWASFLHWAPHPTKEGKELVDKFYFTTAFKIPDWNVRTSLLLIWRNITARYSDFQALVFDENNFFSDQMLELKNTTLSSLGTAILAMIFICVLFIADSSIVFWVSFMLVSMDIGVCGYLSLWGSDLDPTTVVNILMSIGLCIDFATHVGYRTYRSKCRDPDQRISESLGAIGWPVVQAGVSTFLGIIVMLLVPSHVVRMFARTMVLVVATGLFHGLFLLPIIIRSFAYGVGDPVHQCDSDDAEEENAENEHRLRRHTLGDFAQNNVLLDVNKSSNKVGPMVDMEMVGTAREKPKEQRKEQQRAQRHNEKEHGAVPETLAAQQNEQRRWASDGSNSGSEQSTRLCLENTSSSSSSSTSVASVNQSADEHTVDSNRAGGTVHTGGYGSAEKPRKRSRVREANSAERQQQQQQQQTTDASAATGDGEGGERSKSLLLISVCRSPRVCPEG